MTLQLLLLIFPLHLAFAQSNYRDLCSVYCQKESCYALGSNQCDVNKCRTPWVDDGAGNCIINPTSGWIVASVSPDTVSFDSPVGSLDPSDTPTAGVCADNAGHSYDYYGNYNAGGSIVLTDTSVIDIAHYKLRLIFWTILLDQWSNSDTMRYAKSNLFIGWFTQKFKLYIFIIQNIIIPIKADVYSVTTLSPVTTLSQRRDQNKIVDSKICSQADREDEVIFDKTFNHNISEELTFTISTVSSNNGKWGVKQFILLAMPCHQYCTSCFGSLNTQCWYCEQDTPYVLSGTTCADECLPGYGETFGGDICVYCDLKCEVCFQIPYNCSECTPTYGSIYEAYLWADNSSCETVCPVKMWGNRTDHVCYPCEVFCLSCRYAPDYCYECDKTLGYAWNNYTCYSPCPNGTFLDNNATNCTDCSPFCSLCQNSTTTCTLCTPSGYYQAYLLGTDCLRACPPQYYKFNNSGTNNTCEPCDPSCYVCTGNPTPCSQCNPNFFLYQDACVTDCPQPDYFGDVVTWKCLLCSEWCVKLTMNMYFSNALSEKIYVDMNFTEDLDFNTFPYKDFQSFSIDNPLYTIDMFNFDYEITSNSSYRIIIEPKGYIFLYNATFTCTTMDFPGVPHEATNLRPFNEDNYQATKEVVWFVIKAPDMTDGEKMIITGLSEFSDTISNYTTMPYIQELKKMGVFAFLFGGAQITSTSVLVNNIPSQNLYEGVRFWAIFIFFDVPLWEKNSDKTKFFVVPPVSEIINNSRLLQNRELFDTNSIQWRFQRTGHTSFFIFDTYMMVIFIGVCWLLLLIGYCLNKHKPLLFKKHMGKFYSLLHKVHEITILYLMLNTIMEWIYFDGASVQRWLSFAFCLLFNIYFLIYELYIYYDMMKYPVAMIGSEKYQTYAIRYGSLLKNIRYEQYDLKQPWSPKQWFRPYNYHILSYYKKLMMIASLPLFYETTHAQAFILIILQGAQIARFCVIWPFFRRWRNIYRLVLECALMMFFLSILIQGFIVQEIMLNDPDTLEYSIQMFYRFGWVGFGMCFFFNIGFIVLMLFDLVRGCRMSNREMMDEARRVYYYNKLKQYEEENEDVPLGLVNKWVRLGNLNQRNYDELPDVNIRVEYYRIAKLQNANSYEVEMKRLFQLFMNVEYNFSKENNVSIGRKVNKRFTLTRQLSSNFYGLVDDLYHKYYKFGVESIIIKTFQKVEQSLYKPGDRVQLERTSMTQRIEIETHSGQKKIENLSQMMEGFPIPQSDLQFIL